MAGAILLVLFLMSPLDVDAADDVGVPIAVVRVDNLAPVPADYLAFAESRAGRCSTALEFTSRG